MQAILPFLIDGAAKGAAILVLAILITAALRRYSAAVRYLVWTAATASLLLVPVLSSLLPELAVLPIGVADQPAKAHPTVAAASPTRTIEGTSPAAPSAIPDQPINVDSVSLAESAAPPILGSDTITESLATPELSTMDPSWETWLRWLPWIWLGGALVAIAPVLLGRISLWQLKRSADTADGSWRALLDQLRTEIGVHRVVTLLQSPHRTMPMTWGALPLGRATILIPEDARAWLPDRRRAVLLHELAHIRRQDCFTQLLTHIGCALHWFNPLVWYAAHRMLIERERACDDRVLCHETRASTYAQHLLEIAAGPQTPRFTAQAGIAMARRSSIEGRLTDILDPRRNRRAMTRLGIALTVALLAIVVVPIAMLRAQADGEGASQPPSPQERIEQVEKAVEEYAPQQIAPSNDPADQVTISGTLRSIDGRPLPPKGTISYSVETSRSGSTIFTTWRDGRFETEVGPGMIWIVVSADGFAPKLFGPLEGQPGATLEGIEIFLEGGYPAEVHLVDELGNPVANAPVSLSVNFRGSSMFQTHHTDDKGVLHIPHAAKAPYGFSINFPGIQKDLIRDVTLKEGEPYIWKVRRSKPTTLVFRGTDDQPVADALVRIYAETQGDQTQMSGWGGTEVGRTDADGRITADILAENTTYTLLLEARDGRRQLVPDVRAGDANRLVRLDAPITISGRVTGDLSRLTQHQGEPAVGYTLWAKHENSSHGSTTYYASVEIRDGIGYFTIPNLLPVEVSVSTGGVTERIALERSVDDLELHLPELPPVSDQTRAVQIVIKTPPGQPAATGRMRLVIKRAGSSHIESDSRALVDGRVNLELPVGSTIGWDAEQVNGYWFPQSPWDEHATVKPGEGPQVIKIDAVPAGAIIGRIVDVDGQPVRDRGNVSVYVARQPPLKEGLRVDTLHNIKPIDGRFVVSPLPLGGEYAVGTSQGYNYVFTDPLLLDEAHPVREVELRRVQGIDATVIVQDADGNPIAGVPVQCKYSSPYSSHGVSPNPTTDADGRVVFNLNPDAPGKGYTASYFGTRDYIPATVPIRLDGQPTVLRLKRGGVVTGQVVDAETGWPIPGTEVYATPLDRRQNEPYAIEAEGKTDSAGRFRFSNLDPSREYGFNVRRAASASFPSSFRAVPNDGQTLRIPITVSASSGLKPVAPAD